MFDQSYTNWELFVVDNHSTDETDLVLSEYVDPRVTCLKIHNNGVIAKSRNAGVRLSKGDWIAFLDSDDWWARDKLQAVVKVISDEIDFVYHDLEYARDPKSFFSRKKVKSRRVGFPALHSLILKGNCICNSSVVVRKELLSRIGGIDESTSLVAAEDYNTWLRIAALTDKFYYMPRPLGFYFTHNGSVSNRDMSIPSRLAVKEFLPFLTELQRKQVEASFRVMRGKFKFGRGDHREARSDFYFGMFFGSPLDRFRALIFWCATSLLIFFTWPRN